MNRQFDEAIGEMTRAGASATQIAATVGCTTRTVSNARKRLGLAQSQSHRTLTADQVEQILDDTRRGLSCGEIAARVGCGRNTVTNVRRRHGLLSRNWSPFSDAELERAELLLTDGASLMEVARTLGRDKSAVCKRFRGRGWSPQQSGSFTKLLSEMGGVL